MPASSQKLAALASTGNNTHAAVSAPQQTQAVAAQLNVTIIGATPTITYEVQGSEDGVNFKPLSYTTPASATIQTGPRTRTTVSSDLIFLTPQANRLYRYYRVVTSANTNVTYDADIVSFLPGD